MRSYLVETLIVEHSQQRGISWCSVRLGNLQLPLLLLARCQAVTEGLPRHLQTLIWHRTSDGMLVYMALAVLDPCIGQQQAITVFFLIGKLPVNQFTVLLDATTFQQLFARIDRIDDMQVRIAGTHLDYNGLAITGELAIRRIKPVIRLQGWFLVVKAEHDKLDIHFIVSAFCFQAMLARLQLSLGQ